MVIYFHLAKIRIILDVTDRQFDLKHLGSPLEDVVKVMFDELHPHTFKLAVAG